MFLKNHNVHRKTPVLESLFNKFVDLRPATLSKRDSDISFFSVNNAKLLRTASGFLTILAENDFEENHSSVKFVSEINS